MATNISHVGTETGSSFSYSDNNPVRLPDGRPIFANFFNGGAINRLNDEYPYAMGVECTTLNGCDLITMWADVGDIAEPRNYGVRGYPELVLAGSKWGEKRESVGRDFDEYVSSGGVRYWDTTFARSTTGYPVLTEAVPDTEIWVNIDESGHFGAERDIMWESWIHDIKQDTGQGAEIVGTLDNMAGTGSREAHNNCILEIMVHVGPISMRQAGITDSAFGTQNPASYYIDGPFLIGGSWWEIWAGRNGQENRSPLNGQTTTGQSRPNGALVVFNRLGPEGMDINSPYTHDLTAEGRFPVGWSDIMNFTRTQLKEIINASNIWLNGESRSAWMNPTSPDNPFDRMRMPGCTSIGGIEVGLEPYVGASPHGTRIVTQHRELDLIINGSSTGPIPYDPACSDQGPGFSDGCTLEFTLAQDGCDIPITLVGCDLPFTLTGDRDYTLETALCDTCPCYTGPALVVTAGSDSVTLLMNELADFSAVTNPRIRSYLIDGTPVQGRLTPDGNGIILQPPTLSEIDQTQAGLLQVRVDYDNCAGDGTLTCVIEAPLYTVLPTFAGYQGCDICVEQGEEAQFPVIETLEALQPAQPLCQPDFGELTYSNNVWTFSHQPGEFGVAEMMLPIYRGGDRAKKTQRTVRVCVKPPAVLPKQAGCRTVLEVKPCWSDTYIPVGDVNSISLSGDGAGGSSFVSKVTKQRVTQPGGSKGLSIQIGGELRLGSSQAAMQADELVDVRIRTFVKDSGAMIPTLSGTMRVGNWSMPHQPDGKPSFSVSLQSHGRCTGQAYYGQL